MPAHKIQIGADELFRLSQLQCTLEEAAAFFGCSERTLQRRFADEPDLADHWRRGRDYGKASLRRLQWKHANKDTAAAVTMTIHLSKHWLGQTDKRLLEVSGPGGQPIEITDAGLAALSTDELKELHRLLRKMAAAVGGDDDEATLAEGDAVGAKLDGQGDDGDK